MNIGDRVRRTSPDGKHTFFDIDTQAKLDYVRSFKDEGYELITIPVASSHGECSACEA